MKTLKSFFIWLYSLVGGKKAIENTPTEVVNAQSLDEFFAKKLEEYKAIKEQMLQKKEELLIENFSKDLLLKKLNFTPHIMVYKFKKPIYFPHELAQALKDVTGVDVNLKKIRYAKISSAKKHCRWLDGDPSGARSTTSRSDINCLIYGEYALVLEKGFNRLMYVDLEEIDVNCVGKISAYGCADDTGEYIARIIDISAQGIEICRVEEWCYSGERRGRIFYSNFNNPSNEEVTEMIEEFT